MSSIASLKGSAPELGLQDRGPEIPIRESVPNPFVSNRSEESEVLEVPEQQENASRISRVMRVLGAIVLIASAVSFAMQSWAGMEALGRYYTFLGFTAILSAAGVFCGLRMKEDKGARTLLALAAAFLPAHFVQLGALVLSVTSGTPAGIPAFFVLKAPTLAAALTALGIATPLLIAIAFFGFSAMTRSEAKRLTLHYVLANVALLIPVRGPSIVGLFALILFIDLVTLDVTQLMRREVMRTLDGIFARVMLFVPVVCLLFRNLVLYDGTALMLSAMLAMTAITLLVLLPRNMKRADAISLSEALSFVAAGFSWQLFAQGTILGSSHTLAHDYGTVIQYLPCALLFTVMSLFTRSDGSTYRRLASWLAIGAVVVQLFTVPGLLSSFLCVLTGVVTIIGAFSTRERGLLYSGAFGLMIGILYHLRYAAELYTISPWLSLAVTGVLIVVASSYVERNFRSIRERILSFRSQIIAWR